VREAIVQHVKKAATGAEEPSVALDYTLDLPVDVVVFF
jgi:hypothetical protein